jgi:ATP-dependent 26S proteasome regulatory subunit
VAVELPLPDAGGRQRLLELYGRGLALDGVDVAGLVERTEGATPAYIKELMRKAALHAAEAGSGVTVRQEHIQAALDDLAEGGRLAERILGFRPEPIDPELQPPGPLPGMPTGFPWTAAVVRRKG